MQSGAAEVLVLAPFSGVPNVVFDDVYVGQVATRRITVRNPAPVTQLISLPPSKGAFLVGTDGSDGLDGERGGDGIVPELHVAANADVQLAIRWSPLAPGGARETVTLRARPQADGSARETKLFVVLCGSAQLAGGGAGRRSGTRGPLATLTSNLSARAASRGAKKPVGVVKRSGRTAAGRARSARDRSAKETKHEPAHKAAAQTTDADVLVSTLRALAEEVGAPQQQTIGALRRLFEFGAPPERQAPPQPQQLLAAGVLPPLLRLLGAWRREACTAEVTATAARALAQLTGTDAGSSAALDAEGADHLAEELVHCVGDAVGRCSDGGGGAGKLLAARALCTAANNLAIAPAWRATLARAGAVEALARAATLRRPPDEDGGRPLDDRDPSTRSVAAVDAWSGARRAAAGGLYSLSLDPAGRHGMRELPPSVAAGLRALAHPSSAADDVHARRFAAGAVLRCAIGDSACY